ncbi:MAG TPA: MqnA/MqnD/SBP family protein [Gaiellaceae bacterium]|nr:MqnA/MqnD/SBP family protein [Gaiellaceae bacterium]
MLIRLGHSPDPDDAFMVWALAEERVDTRGLEFELVPADIQTLNEWAHEARLEVTALSAAAYPVVQDDYLLLPHGASLGSGYGPIVVAREQLSRGRLQRTRIAIPGRLTTAYLVLRMYLGGDFIHEALPFDEILPAVADGRADAGLLIHEGQLTYGDSGVEKCADLGEWWLLETGLPLPLGVNTVRRDLGADTIRTVSAVLQEAIRAGLDHRSEALGYARRFGRDLDDATVDRFVGMYVNELTCDLGDEGRQAVRELYARADEMGIYDAPVRAEFAE